MADWAQRDGLSVGVAGAGAMGRGIAQVLAVAGVSVRLMDAKEGAAEAARGFVAKMLARAVEKGRIDKAEADAAVERIEVVDTAAGMAACGAVIEAIVEDLEIKRALFAELERHVADDCILATNTSSLSVTEIAAGCARPQRVAGFHFFNPVPLMRIVEVIEGARTEGWVMDALADLARRFGHRPARTVDSPGFLINNAGRAYVTEAARLLDEGIADHATLDAILRETLGFPMGPFELLDLTGLDVSVPVMESIYAQFHQEPRFRPSPTLRRRLAAGLLGRKTGEGFYRYAADGRKYEPTPAPPPEGPRLPIWVDPGDKALFAEVAAILGSRAEKGEAPSPDAVCLITPEACDASRAALGRGLDPARTLALETTFGLRRHRTLMATPATRPEAVAAARAALSADGVAVSVIADSPGFVATRVAACIVNGACEIAHLGIASPEDIDAAVPLGLGYPTGPLALGDALGPKRVVAVLEDLQAFYGDPRYRPSAWLRRRAALGLSLLDTEAWR